MHVTTVVWQQWQWNPQRSRKVLTLRHGSDSGDAESSAQNCLFSHHPLSSGPEMMMMMTGISSHYQAVDR
jgi:hypothetical protein